MLFSDRSLWTMFHGIVLSGGALIVLVVAIHALRLLAPVNGDAVPDRNAKAVVHLTTVAAVLLWLAVLGGTYIVFPMYRAAPPEGVTALADYPRALLLSNPDTAWLHGFGMEVKEHVPWIAAMMVTAAAFLVRRHPAAVLSDAGLRRATGTMLSVSLVMVLFVALLGMFVNKVAPVW